MGSFRKTRQIGIESTGVARRTTIASRYSTETRPSRRRGDVNDSIEGNYSSIKVVNRVRGGEDPFAILCL